MDAVSSTSILRAYERARKKVEKEGCTSSLQSAGFLLRGKQGSQTGVQVFVKVCRYSDELLAQKPETGGLACEERQ